MVNSVLIKDDSCKYCHIGRLEVMTCGWQSFGFYQHATIADPTSDHRSSAQEFIALPEGSFSWNNAIYWLARNVIWDLQKESTRIRDNSFPKWLVVSLTTVVKVHMLYVQLCWKQVRVSLIPVCLLGGFFVWITHCLLRFRLKNSVRLVLYPWFHYL